MSVRRGDLGQPGNKGWFASYAAPEPTGVDLVDDSSLFADPESLTPDEAFDMVCDPDLIDRYTLGDCAVLADAVARRNGWGVVVVGRLEESEWGGDVEYEVETLIHAWARRPDGALVDIRGVHPPDVAERRAADWGVDVHTYTTADDHAAQWDPDQWVDDDEDTEVARLVAGLVSRFGAVYEAGHVEE